MWLSKEQVLPFLNTQYPFQSSQIIVNNPYASWKVSNIYMEHESSPNSILKYFRQYFHKILQKYDNQYLSMFASKNQKTKENYLNNVSTTNARQLNITKNQYKITIILSIMQKLYAIAFQRILNRLGKQSIESGSIQEFLSNQGIREVGNFVFHRLPRDQFKNFVKTPCPITELSETSQKSLIVIDASKRLRSNFSIDEKKVCSRCSFQDKCPHFGIVASPNTANALPDVLVFMDSMNGKSLVVQENDEDYRVWKSGYKSCDSILAVIEDLRNGGKQTYEFEKLRLQHVEEKKTEEQETQILQQRSINMEQLTTTKTQQRKENYKIKQENRKQNSKPIQRRGREEEELDDQEEVDEVSPQFSKKYAKIFQEEERFLNNQGPERQAYRNERNGRNERSERSERKDRNRQYRNESQNRYLQQKHRGRDGERPREFKQRRNYNERRQSLEDNQRQYNGKRTQDYRRSGQNEGYRSANRDGQRGRSWEDRKDFDKPRKQGNTYRRNDDFRPAYEGNQRRNKDERSRSSYKERSEENEYQNLVDKKFKRAGSEYHPSNTKVHQQWEDIPSKQFKRNTPQNPRSERKTPLEEERSYVIRDVEYATSQKRENQESNDTVRRGRRVRK